MPISLAANIDVQRNRIADLERVLLADLEDPDLERDAGGSDPESLREEVRRRGARVS